MIKKQAPARRPPPTQEQTPVPNTQQFKATPRFNFSSTPRHTPSQSLPVSTQSATRYLTPARPTLKQEDIIDDSSDGIQDVHESVESERQDFDYLNEDLEDDFTAEEPKLKRRKLSSSPMLLDEYIQTEEEPQNQDSIPDPASSPPLMITSPAARRPVLSTAPRFLISTPAPQSLPRPAQTTFLKPPRFRPPDPPSHSEPQAEPLPEQFSPHRRGQKYVAGGLAAEVRDWLVNIENTVPANPTGTTQDSWLVKVHVDEISGGGRAGMTLVRGRQVHSGDLQGMLDTLGVLKVVLAGEGQGTALQKGIKLEVGKTVGIKGPVWEIVVEGEKWGIGVDWKVLT